MPRIEIEYTPELVDRQVRLVMGKSYTLLLLLPLFGIVVWMNATRPGFAVYAVSSLYLLVLTTLNRKRYRRHLEQAMAEVDNRLILDFDSDGLRIKHDFGGRDYSWSTLTYREKAGLLTLYHFGYPALQIPFQELKDDDQEQFRHYLNYAEPYGHDHGFVEQNAPSVLLILLSIAFAWWFLSG